MTRVCLSTDAYPFPCDQREEILAPYLQAMARFRDEVRKLSRTAAPHKHFLQLADKLRDVDLAQLGVALEDQDDGSSLVKLVPVEQLMAARAEKERFAAEKEAKKQENAERERKKRIEQLEKGRFAPEVMFEESPTYKAADGTSLFKEFDEAGFPTQDAQGEEISKSKRKNLEKDRKIQEKLHKAFSEAKAKGEIE